MQNRNYSEKLKDPRWQKKRLEILQRDNFTCQYCGETTKTLHVHHIIYSNEPWESEDWELNTVCEDCHTISHYNHFTALELELIRIIQFSANPNIRDARLQAK